jgi:hypothetical protein
LIVLKLSLINIKFLIFKEFLITIFSLFILNIIYLFLLRFFFEIVN